MKTTVASAQDLHNLKIFIYTEPNSHNGKVQKSLFLQVY